MGDLSIHFTRKDMACRCCGDLKIEKRLLAALETLQELASAPVVVEEGYRCHTRNTEVGAVSDSEHTRGMAADIRIPGLSLQEMYELALRVPEFLDGGIGVYDGGFLHLDVRKGSSRWARVRGQYVGIQHLVQEPARVEQKRLAQAG